MLSAALAAIVLAGVAAGVGREIGRSLRFALPFALLITIINPLVYPEGDTLLIRGGEILGRQIDITLEATAAGAFNGLRVIVIVTAFGLMSAAVDPDQLLRLFRRVSYRSALTATLATRLVPVLARDATRMGDAARCRPHPPGRLTVARAALAGALDRAVDVAAALEVRGYSLGGRTVGRRQPWSRHDWRVGGAAVAIARRRGGRRHRRARLRRGVSHAPDRDRRARDRAERRGAAARPCALRRPRCAHGGGACLSRWWWPSASATAIPRPASRRCAT